MNPDSARLALVSGFGLAVVLLLLRLSGVDLSTTALVLAPVTAVAVTYFASARLIGRPIRRVVAQLQRVENRDLGAFPEPTGRSGDLATLDRAVIRTGRALEKELAKLRQIETYRKDFLGNVSHELKTPIFAIRGFAETLLGGALEDASVRVDFVEKILRNADRLDNLANDLSEIAQIETGVLTMRFHTFDLADVMREVVEELEQRASAKGIALACTVAQRLPKVRADAARIRQVLLNLVDNGIKYTHDGGTVGVAARGVDGKVKVTVSDSGIGIPPEYVDRVTERFFRVDPSRSRAQGGTGLGLAIVKHILNAHSTQLLIESSPGHGSVFGFSLNQA